MQDYEGQFKKYFYVNMFFKFNREFKCLGSPQWVASATLQSLIQLPTDLHDKYVAYISKH